MNNGTPKEPRLPAFLRIESDLRRRIEEGEWPVGDVLPGRHILAKEYGVALNTLQRGMESLFSEGLLEARPRMGTFVKRTPPRQAAPFVPVQGSAQDQASSVLAIVAPAQATRMGPAGLTPDNWPGICVQAMERTFSLAAGRCRDYPIDWPWEATRPGELTAAVKQAAADGVDAIAITNLNGHPDWEAEARMLNHMDLPPCVYVSMLSSRLPVVSVCGDQYYNGRQAAEHLALAGYSRVCVLQPFRTEWLRRRAEGVLSALDTSPGVASAACYPAKPERDWGDYLHLTAEGQHAVIGETVSGALDAMGWTPGGRGVCALVAPNDREACIVKTVLEDRGIPVGSGVGLIGFDGSPQARAANLSTLCPPLEQLGETAARTLIAILEGKHVPFEARFTSHMIARDSTFVETQQEVLVGQYSEAGR